MTGAIFAKFLYMLPMAVARSSSGRVTKSQGEGEILGFYFPLTMHCSGMNFATKDRFHLNLLILLKPNRI